MDAPLSPPPLDVPAFCNGELGRWLHEARNGSVSALGNALEASRKYLLLVANRELDCQLRSKAGGSDLVQDTFLEAQKSFRAFRGDTEAEFLGWLKGILAHRVSNTVRHYRRTQFRDLNREVGEESFEAVANRFEDNAATPATCLLAHDEQRRVQIALEQLGEPWRSVLIERTWDGDSFADIGARRNCSPAAARMLWVRAVGKMQRYLSLLE